MRRVLLAFLASATVAAAGCTTDTSTVAPRYAPDVAAASPANIGINVVLREAPTQADLSALDQHGKVMDIIAELNAVTMRSTLTELSAIQALPFVLAAGPDQERDGSPIDLVPATNFDNGLNTWNLDAIDVTDIGVGRVVPQDGSGVYVGVLDTGLLDSWRQYFPQERIAEEYGIAFGGGGGNVGTVSSQPLKWEHDQNSHGTHVTSTILGYSFGGTPINGVAPMAQVIPVKVLNQNGSGWSSVIARGIVYIADLKKGALAGHPVVINMSLGGGRLDPLEKSAIDYAIGQGVIVVAAAGNAGSMGMDYPGAYAPVISVASAGWIGEWYPGHAGNWWYALNVADPSNPAQFYISAFSGRQKTGQDLDVAAPGSWVVGPYQVNSGQTSYYFLGGTSMATPHVAGIVALMAQKDPNLTASQAESILESTATPLPAGSRTVYPAAGASAVTVSWGDNAAGAGLVSARAALAATP